jgi:mannose-6-phosphate isomerase-like protein (cupin superfamily)
MNVSTRSKNTFKKISKCHDGIGAIIFREVFSKNDFRSKLEFLHETEILPNSTIGYHAHEGNEEIYYIISGKGIMVVDSEEREVKAGDAIVTYGGSSHGLINTGDENLKILVFESTY